jgi:hypothetical protein
MFELVYVCLIIHRKSFGVFYHDGDWGSYVGFAVILMYNIGKMFF